MSHVKRNQFPIPFTAEKRERALKHNSITAPGPRLPLLYFTDGTWNMETNGTYITKRLARRACKATRLHTNLRNACDTTIPDNVKRVTMQFSKYAIQMQLRVPLEFNDLPACQKYRWEIQSDGGQLNNSGP